MIMPLGSDFKPLASFKTLTFRKRNFRCWGVSYHIVTRAGWGLGDGLTTCLQSLCWQWNPHLSRSKMYLKISEGLYYTTFRLTQTYQCIFDPLGISQSDQPRTLSAGLFLLDQQTHSQFLLSNPDQLSEVRVDLCPPRKYNHQVE